LILSFLIKLYRLKLDIYKLFIIKKKNRINIDIVSSQKTHSIVVEVKLFVSVYM